eukprot:217074-Amphidinium_carterae.1
MKTHQTDRDAVEGRVDCSDLHRRMWLPTEVPENMCPSSLPRSGSNGPPFVRVFWPRVRFQASEFEPEVVDSERPVRFPAEPFVCGPHLYVVEHETYAICLDCLCHVGVHTGRGRLNYHALKGRPCKPLLRKKRAKLVSGFANQVDEVDPNCFNGQCFVWGDKAAPDRCRLIVTR